MNNHSWSFIKDLPQDWKKFASIELNGLSIIWKESSKTLKKRDAIKHFNEKLKREWAIETGIIENLYSIERGTTVLLIEHGIAVNLIKHGTTDKSATEVVRILKDQENVLEALFDFVSGKRTLSTSYIKELHQLFTLHQDDTDAESQDGAITKVPLIKGDWKQQPNNPKRPDGSIYEYCPPEHVAAEMDNLISMHHEHVKQSVPTEIEAAWFHHRFTQIHPFQDGNGRVARALASLIFMQNEWFPLVIDRTSRDKYISSLEAADGSDLQPLVNLFVSKQKAYLRKALSLTESTLKDIEDEKLQQVYQAARDRLETRERDRVREIQQSAFEKSKILENIAEKHFKLESGNLNSQVLTVNKDYYSSVRRNDQGNSGWFLGQIIETAKKLEYFADTRTYRAWVRLKIKEERQAELIVSFHCLGYDFVGLMAISAFMEYRDRSENGEIKIDGPYTICDEIFEFHYIEPEDSMIRRFNDWLNNIMLIGLDQWKRQL